MSLSHLPLDFHPSTVPASDDTSRRPSDLLDFMDCDSVSPADTPTEFVPLSSYDKQRESLQAYVNSLPYQCESFEQMDEKLHHIVEMVSICVRSRNWVVLSSWDGLLQCWLLMRYPIQKPVRAKLVRLYYELSVMPGLEPRVVRGWTEMLTRLLANKPGSKRKLDPQDLQLPWQPLWQALQKELWPKKSIQDTTRNVVNIFLYVAEQCKAYYPASEIPAMLDAFLPLVTKDTALNMLPVLTSFLPPTHIHLYLPVLFTLWEAFNSSIFDDRLLDLAGFLSEEHVVSQNGVAENEGGAKWGDVGIWSQKQWNVLIGKGLGSMNVPVGAIQGASTTASQADSMADKASLRVKKTVNRFHSLARIIVYSLAVDSDARENRAGYVAGSRALESLDRLITSTESFFHPSNAGTWTQNLSYFLLRLTSEFTRRLKEEEYEFCRIPVSYRLTPEIRRSFVTILRTPALLAMFSKDSTAAGYAQGALRLMALLEPSLVMPDLLERAYGGLEVVNETHRTTTVLNMLACVPLPLVSEKIWFRGQKHVIPLLELAVPGIDLNDPNKTLSTTSFIVSIIQHLKIGDLTQYPSKLSTDDVDPDFTDTSRGDMAQLDQPKLTKAEERSLARDSTAGFADWVISLLRRILALFENLPEEGGRRNMTGGKQEENVLKSIKAMMDIVCLHLSDELFGLVLNLLYDYGTTNAKSNAVQAFGQLVSCLARVKPDVVMAKFLPFCVSQIEDELKHGASSIRTTSAHAAVPSDTTLHWNISILRGCLGFGGQVLLQHKQQILDLMTLLVKKTKSERGYSSTGRLITRVLHTIAETYPLNSRFVNSVDWNSEYFKSDHNTEWGRFHNPEDVVIEWHVPSNEEIEFVLEILDKLFKPALDEVEKLLGTTPQWDSVARNDFCRLLHTCRAVWGGLSTFLQEAPKQVVNPCLHDTEISELVVSFLDVKAGFTLIDPADPRYKTAAAHRTRFGEICHRAASTLRRNTSEGEDHIDAVLGVTRAIDTFLLGYALNKSDFDSLRKNYLQARDANRFWPKQRDNSRLVFLKRAHVYHSSRVYMHSLYRRRSELDDRLLGELVELSLFPYTRIRRQAQAVLHNVYGYYVRSARYTLPSLFHSLEKGNDPDRMKGSLYILWNKAIVAYALGDPAHHKQYLLSLLACQHEEKPSIQKLVSSIAQDCLINVTEEALHADTYALNVPRVDDAIREIESDFPLSPSGKMILNAATDKASDRIQKWDTIYDETVSSIVEIASRPTTHWRYVQMALRFLVGLLRRDVSAQPELAKLLFEQSTSVQPKIRSTAQKAIVKLLEFVKMRTYSSSRECLWRETWSNPLEQEIKISDPETFLYDLGVPLKSGVYIDKIQTGFLVWAHTTKAYQPPGHLSGFTWDAASQPALKVIREIVSKESYFRDLALLWSQETGNVGGNIDLRKDNVLYVKVIVKILENDVLENLLPAIESSLSDPDKFYQRAGAELLAGLLRGSKHWPSVLTTKLWTWTSARLDMILSSMKPETLPLWDSFFRSVLRDWDPRRNQPLVDWIFGLPLDFNNDSVFEMNKTITLFELLIGEVGMRFRSRLDDNIQLFFDNANTSYAELRSHMCQIIWTLINHEWQPAYQTTEALLTACRTSDDPLHIRDAKYVHHVHTIMEKLSRWRENRFPPPRVSQSEYDKVAMTMLYWTWTSLHSPQAALMLPYIMPMLPEIFRMTELNDNAELHLYSSAALYILSAVFVPGDRITTLLGNFTQAIKSSKAWRIRLYSLPAMLVFFYRNLMTISADGLSQVMDVLLDCLGDDNVEVRQMACKVFSGVVRCSQRQNIVPLKNRFTTVIGKVKLPPRRDPGYADSMRRLHSGILGLCALIESSPYSVESWMPPLTEVLAPHAADPPPISTTIRKCASEFKKTHQDTWHKDQLMFNEDQLQSLSTMLIGTSYYA